MEGIKKADVNEAGLGGQHACGVPHCSSRAGDTQDSQVLWSKRNDKSQRVYKNLQSFISKLYTWQGNWSVIPL